MISGKLMVNDENSHHALRKMAGLGLFFKQQQRDNGTISYNNPQELLQLLQCSHSLKTFHPELFDRYAFKKKILMFCVNYNWSINCQTKLFHLLRLFKMKYLQIILTAL